MPDLIPAEVAFENIDYFTPSSKAIKGITTKETILTEKVRSDGTTVTLKICIVASGKYGLPITSDLDYYRALLKILDDTLARDGQITEPISLPTKTLLRYAGKPEGTHARREVKDWIRRGHTTPTASIFLRPCSTCGATFSVFTNDSNIKDAAENAVHFRTKVFVQGDASVCPSSGSIGFATFFFVAP
jgi:hypothetical protein